jgi:hypothetical protein
MVNFDKLIFEWAETQSAIDEVKAKLSIETARGRKHTSTSSHYHHRFVRCIIFITFDQCAAHRVHVSEFVRRSHQHFEHELNEKYVQRKSIKWEIELQAWFLHPEQVRLRIIFFISFCLCRCTSKILCTSELFPPPDKDFIVLGIVSRNP